MQDDLASYKRTLEQQRQRHAAQIKDLCAEARDEEERQRARALSTHLHDDTLAAQRELVDLAMDKLFLHHPPPPQLPAGPAQHPEDVRQEARERVTTAVGDMSRQVEHLVRTKWVMQWQMAVKDRKLQALLHALDTALSAQSIAENRCLALQARRQADRASEDGSPAFLVPSAHRPCPPRRILVCARPCLQGGASHVGTMPPAAGHAWSHAQALEQQLAVVCEQLEATNERAIKLSAALAQAQQQRDSSAAALHALERRQVFRPRGLPPPAPPPRARPPPCCHRHRRLVGR